MRTSAPMTAAEQAPGAGTSYHPDQEISSTDDHQPPSQEHIVDGDEQTNMATQRMKKTKKRKSKSKRTAKAGTGYEEYFVDAPVTPAEHEEEKGLYHTSLPFAQRIETAIQRYVAKRNMDSVRKALFDRYLTHGGIEGGPKMFSGGLDNQTLADKDAEDIATLAATNFVAFDKSDPRNEIFVVDFEGCLKSYLSYNVPSQHDLGSFEQVTSLVHVLRNFLNYLLHHDVCPEFSSQIQASKSLLNIAEEELWATSECSRNMPGSFNKACSELFGGLYQGKGNSLNTWLDEEELATVKSSQGLSPDVARKIFKLGLAAMATPETFEMARQQLRSGTVRAIDVCNVSMEVTEVIFPTNDALGLYAHSTSGFCPVGTMKAKTWISPFEPPVDLTEEEEEGKSACDPRPIAQYEFAIEENILQHCFIGMKFDATVTKLNIGISYFDAVFGVYCSFFNISANERMMGWKEPEGDGNWLPMRKTGMGALDDREEGSEEAVQSSMLD